MKYDLSGSVTNVIDPFNGNTKLEYDRVGRRTKRTLPNGVVTEWQYDWRDRVTNIVHKTSGGSVLASFGYVRNGGGEPNRITREDGTYVELKYDAAWRLTNEVYKASGGSVTDEISYGYDAAGNRTNLVKSGVTLTNGVSGGYRIKGVTNASSGIQAESYGYDDGGRVTSITRDSATLNLGYNTSDQVIAVTNGATWVSYVHDANGRRTISTNSAGTVRRWLVAPTPGSDLESPHLIANAGGTVQQGYVYVGDQPLLRFDGAGNRIYYLEDAMGSVAALANSAGTATVANFNYDGFGNVRSQSGTTNAPSGTGGDFRFHGAWLEEGSGLYNMRAREYDARLGRFTSRDPAGGDFKFPETLPPYIYANNNGYIQRDLSGLFSMPEINIVGLIQEGLAAFKTAAITYARSWARDKVQSFFVSKFTDLIKAYLPGNFDPWKDVKGGRAFEGIIKSTLCLADIGWFHFEVGVHEESGNPVDNGLSCHNYNQALKIRNKIRRPDIIIGPRDPIGADNSPNKEWLTVEIKLREQTLIAYGGTKKKGQLDAILKYAAKHQLAKVAAFVALTGGKNSQAIKDARVIVGREATRHGVVAVVFSLQSFPGKRLK